MELIDPKYARVSQILSIFQAYAHVPIAKLRKAQDIGTEIHGAIEAYFRGHFEPIRDKNAPYLEPFLKWADIAQPEPVLIEERLYDHELMITGRIDLLADVYDFPCIVDFKTGSWAHPDIWQLQMTFYKHLLDVNKILPTCTHFMVVHLKKDGTYDVYEYNYSPSDMDICLSALKCYRYFVKSFDINERGDAQLE